MKRSLFSVQETRPDHQTSYQRRCDQKSERHRRDPPSQRTPNITETSIDFQFLAWISEGRDKISRTFMPQTECTLLLVQFCEINLHLGTSIFYGIASSFISSLSATHDLPRWWRILSALQYYYRFIELGNGYVQEVLLLLLVREAAYLPCRCLSIEGHA